MSIKARTPNSKIGETDISSAADEALERSPLIPSDAVDEEEMKKIEQFLKDTELAGGSIRLERKGPSDSSYQYCTKIRVDDGFDLDLIKRVWGGGDYKAKTFRSNGQMYKSFTFSIDYRIKGSMDMAGSTTPATDDTKSLVALAQIMKPDSSQNNMLVKFMEQSANQSNQMMTMFMAMSQQSQQQMMTMMTAMATAMGGNKTGGDVAALIPVLTAMINRPIPAVTSEKGSNLVELIEAMKAMKELAVPGSVPPEKEEESVFDKIIKYGGPVLAAILTRQPIQMPDASGQAAPLQLPPPGGPAPAPSGQLPPEFTMYVNMILGAATKNADTGTYVGLIADNLDDQQSTILCGILQQPDWIQKLAETDRRVLNFVPWFTKLRNELLEEYGLEQPNQPDAGNHAAQDENVSRPIPGGAAPVIVIPGAAAGPAT